MEFENNKIDRLASLVEEFIEKYPIASSRQNNDVLSRLEAKVDVIAQTGGVDYIELAISDLKQEIEDKQNVLEEKVSSLEDIVKTIINISTEEVHGEKNLSELNEQIDDLNSSISALKDEFYSSQYNMNKIYEKLENTAESDLESLKSLLSKYDLKFNELNSKFDRVKLHIEKQVLSHEDEKDDNDEYVKNTLEKLELITTETKEICKNSQSEKISQLKGEVKGIANKFDVVFELLKAVPSEDGIEDIKLAINEIEDRLNEFSGFLAEIKSLAATSCHSNNANELKGLKNNFSDLEELLKGTNESINNLLEQKSAEFNTEVANQVESFQQELEQLKETSASMQGGIENIQLMCEEDASKSQFEEITQEIAGLEKYFKTSLELLKKDLSTDTFNQKLVALTSLLKDLNNYTFDNTKAINERLSSLVKNETIEEFKNNLQNSSTELTGRLDEIRERVSQENLDDKLSEIKFKIEDGYVKEDLGEVISRLEDIKDRLQLEEIDNALNYIKSQIQENSVKEEVSSILDKMQNLDVINAKLSDLAKSETIEDLQNNLTDKSVEIVESLEQIKDKIFQKELDQKLSEVKNKIDELPVKNDMENLAKSEAIEDLQNNLTDKSVEIVERLEQIKDKISQKELDQKLSEVKNKIDELPVKNDMENLAKSEIIEDLQNNLTDKNVEIVERLEQIKDKVSQKELDQKLSEVKNKIDELPVKNDIDSILDKMQSVDSINDNIANLAKSEAIEDLQNNLTDKNVEIVERLEQIKDKVSQKELDQKLSEVKNKIDELPVKNDIDSILDKMQSVDSINDNIANLAKSEAIEDLQNNLTDKNFEIIERLENIKDRVSQEELNQTLSDVKKQIEELAAKSDIKSIGELLNKINENVSFIEESDSKIIDLQQKAEKFVKKEDIYKLCDKLQEVKDQVAALEVEEQIEELKDKLSFTDTLADIKNKADELYVRDEVVEIIGRLEELKDRFATESIDIKDEVANISKAIQELKEKPSVIDSAVTKKLDKLNSKLKELIENKSTSGSNELDKLYPFDTDSFLSLLNDKFDKLNINQGNIDISPEIEEIKNQILSLETEEKFEDLSFKLDEVKNNIRTLGSLSAQVNREPSNNTEEIRELSERLEYIKDKLLENSIKDEVFSILNDIKVIKDNLGAVEQNPESPGLDVKISIIYEELNELKAFIENISKSDFSSNKLKCDNNHYNDVLPSVIDEAEKAFDRIINIVLESKRITEEFAEGVDNSVNISKNTNERIDSLLKNIFEVNNTNNELSEIITNNNSQINRLHETIINNNNGINQLHKSIDNNNNGINQLHKSIDNNNNGINQLHKSIDNNNHEINQLHELIDNNNHEINQLHEFINNNNNGINQLHESININISQLSETININIAKINKLYEASNSNNNNIDHNYNLNQLNQTVSNNYSSIINKQEEIKDQIRLNSKELLKLSDLLEETSNVSLTPSPSSIMDLRNDITNIYGRFNEIKADLSDLSSKTNNFMRNTSGDNEFIKSSLNECRQLIESPTKEINDRLNKLNSNLDSSNEGLKNNLVQIGFSVQDSRKHIINTLKELFNLINKLNYTVNNNQNTYMTVKNILVQLAEWIDGAGTLVEIIKDDVKDIKDDKLKKLFVEFKLIKEEMQSVEQKHSKEIEKLLTAGNQKNEELQSIIVSLKNELNNALEKFDSNFIKVSKRIEKLEGNIGTVLTQSDKEHKELKNLNVDILSKLKGLATDISLSREDISTSYKRIEATLERAGGANSIIKSELNALFTGLEQNNINNFQKLDAELTGVSQQMSNINHSISAYEARIREELRKLNQSFLDNSTIKDSGYEYTGDFSNFEDKLNYLVDTSFKQMRNVVDENLKRIYSRFSNIEARFQHLDKKLDLIQKAQDGVRTQEDRSILEFIAGQVTAMNETGKNSTVIIKRMDLLEKRILDFDLKLNKLVGVLDKFEGYPNEYSDAAVDTNF